MFKDAVYALEMRQLLLSEDLHALKLHAMHLIHNHFCYPLITLIILPPLAAPCHCGHFMTGTGMSSFLFASAGSIPESCSPVVLLSVSSALCLSS